MEKAVKFLHDSHWSSECDFAFNPVHASHILYAPMTKHLSLLAYIRILFNFQNGYIRSHII